MPSLVCCLVLCCYQQMLLGSVLVLCDNGSMPWTSS
uniref:Uncharacterized protein n=1 Tax=Setaria viridis TaxID=4556 RepID=A0A4U6T0J1_SETVI|nr:hypothetical protein SEVIR_9G249733v2 [Setaria viridis]